MTQEQKDRNVRLAEALESGKYTQIKAFLKTDDGHCCIGVACELVKGSVNLKEISLNMGYQTQDNKETKAYGFEHMDQFGVLTEEVRVAPDEIAKLYGWELNGYISSNPAISIDGNEILAAMANDRGATFQQIAQGFRKLAADSPLETP